MVALHSPLPASIKELAGNALACANSRVEGLQDTIHVLCSDGFGLVVTKKVITGCEATNGDDVFATSGRHRSGNFGENFRRRDLTHGFGLGVRRSTNSRA